MIRNIFMLIAFALGITTAEAQVTKIYKSGKLVAQYTFEEGYSVVFSKTKDGESKAPANAQAVDLGLSVKWANMNVGATKPEGKGTYFAWGEVTGCEYINYTECTPAIMDGNPNGWSAGVNSNYVSGGPKTDFGSWTYYKWYNGSTYYKYTTSTKTTLDPEDDAAHVNWGGDWRMPTHAERTELVNNCYWVWTSSYNGTGVPGYIVYKALSDSDKGTKVYSASSAKSDYTLSVNHIFLPAAGYRFSSSFGSVGSYGGYWSSSLGESSSLYAWFLDFSGSSVRYSLSSRFFGQSVRAVCR